MNKDKMKVAEMCVDAYIQGFTDANKLLNKGKNELNRDNLIEQVYKKLNETFPEKESIPNV